MKTLERCRYLAVKPITKTIIDQLEDGLKRYKGNGDEQRAAHDCMVALTLVSGELKELIESIYPTLFYNPRAPLSDSTNVKQALSTAVSILASVPAAKKLHKADLILMAYQKAFAVLVDAAGSVRKDNLLAFYSMAGEILHKAARLCGALKKEALRESADLEVVALVISEYVLGPATRKSLMGRIAVSRTYYLAAITAVAAKDLPGAKVSIKQAKKYSADSVHAARFVAGFVSYETLSALRLYLKIQFMRFQLEKYTDEDWDFNVLHEWYTYLLEQLKVSR